MKEKGFLEAQNVFKGSQDYESLVLVSKPFFFV
jgi:hypothetical protein